MYETLDSRILAAVTASESPLHSRAVYLEASRIATQTGRESFRVIDARLQSLRRSKVIRYATKAENNGKAGWLLVAPAKP